MHEAPEFAEQFRQFVAAVVSEYLPDPQLVHALLVFVSLYVPAEHAVHAFPLGHVVSVRSTPLIMASVIAVMAATVKSSSTKKKPAMSAFKYSFGVASQGFPRNKGIVLSASVPVDNTVLTLMLLIYIEYALEDV